MALLKLHNKYDANKCIIVISFFNSYICIVLIYLQVFMIIYVGYCCMPYLLDTVLCSIYDVYLIEKLLRICMYFCVNKSNKIKLLYYLYQYNKIGMLHWRYFLAD